MSATAFWTWIAILIIWTVLYYEAHKHLHEVEPFSRWFHLVQPLEDWLWLRSRTILASRLVALVSLILTIHDTIMPALVGINWAPFLPPAYVQFVPLAGVLLGVLFELLRRVTTAPVKV